MGFEGSGVEFLEGGSGDEVVGVVSVWHGDDVGLYGVKFFLGTSQEAVGCRCC